MVPEAVKPVYVLQGGDSLLLDQCRREIVAKAVGSADPQTCVGVYDADAELAAVLDELRTMPFLAPRRVVIVRNADAFISAHREALENYLESPSAAGVLVLMVSAWASNTRLYKLVGKIGQVMQCSAPKAGGLIKWIRDAAAGRGKKIAPDAAELLAHWVGQDLAALDGEIEKLSLYAGARQSLTVEDVSALVTATAGPEAFDLTNALTAGDVGAALKALEGMVRRRGEEFKVLGMIAWHLRRVLAAQQAIRSGSPPQRAAPKMPWAQQQPFLAMLQRRPLKTIQADFRRLIYADLAMKSGVDPAAAMQKLVVELCV